MCGIAGFLGPDLIQQELSTASDWLAHRGPDDEGFYLDGRAGLAVRRLSIIDLEGGHQPLCNEDRTLWLACNGEIYNAAELRRELQVLGHIFRSRTDIEVILHTWEQWGDATIERLCGMFAFALWDTRQERLVLGRDRFGIKPLFYARSGERFAFASECRALPALLPDLPRRANLQALYYFQVGFVPNPLTIFDQVWELPAAHMLIAETGLVAIRAYWKLTYPSGPGRSPFGFQAASQQFIEQAQQAIQAWSMSDVPYGALLSANGCRTGWKNC